MKQGYKFVNKNLNVTNPDTKPSKIAKINCKDFCAIFFNIQKSFVTI